MAVTGIKPQFAGANAADVTANSGKTAFQQANLNPENRAQMVSDIMAHFSGNNPNKAQSSGGNGPLDINTLFKTASTAIDQFQGGGQPGGAENAGAQKFGLNTFA